jgi:WD40 repeat protein
LQELLGVKTKYALTIVAVIGPLVVASLGTRAAGAEVVPQKQPLAIPVTVAAPRTIECVVTAGPITPISDVVFSPDGKLLAAMGHQEVVLWDLENAKLLRRIASGATGGALAFLKDGRQLAIGSGVPCGPGGIRLVDIETGQPTHVFEGPKDIVYSIAVSPDGNLLAAGGADRIVRVWNTENKQLVKTLDQHTGWVLCVAFSRDGKLLVTAGADNMSRVWKLENWEMVAELPDSDAVLGAAMGADGITIATVVGGQNQRGLRFRRTDNRRSIRSYPTGVVVPLDVSWSTKNMLYVPCSNGAVRVYDNNGGLRATLAGHTDWVYSVALSADETKLASTSADGTVKLWNTADNKLIATLVQISPSSDEWLILTADGYVAASSPTAIQWKTANVEMPPADLAALLQKPELVRDAIALKKITPPAVK